MVTRKSAFYSTKTGNIDAEAWLNHVAAQRPESRLRLIRNASLLSQLTSAHHTTPLGSSCLRQGLIMADLLLDLMPDEDTICAALLYHAVCYAELDLETVEQQLNSNVTKLLKGVLRMSNMNQSLALNSAKQSQIEKLRKMLFSMADDMRVVLLKLVERIALMRAAKEQTTRNQATRTYAREILTIYAPLANRLGTHDLRYELEDLAMEQLTPRLYKRMSCLLKEPLISREQYIKELAQAIEVILPKINIYDFKITSRAKNFYGAYQKMLKKKVPLRKIYDLNAIRIIVNTKEECYQVVEVIRTLWTSVPESFDDYIQTPKENNYRSIHLAIYGDNDKIVEIQVRTFEMDQESEHGLAAHWEYKENALHKPDYNTKIKWLRQVLTWQKELVNRGVYLMPELTATLDDRVYVLTREGNIIDLPKGATALDFAYHIQADVGHYCDTVFVDGVPKAFTYVLRTGEQVEILTGVYTTVSWDWLEPSLGYLNTAQAKAKVLHWFQKKEHYQHIVTGQLLLDKSCHQLGITSLNKEALAHNLAFSSKQELLAALGNGELRLGQALHALHRYNNQSSSYPMLDSSGTALTIQEEQPSYNTQAVTHRIKITAASIDVLQEILKVARKQNITVFSLSLDYQVHEKTVYITLCFEDDYTPAIQTFFVHLQVIKGVLSVDTQDQQTPVESKT